MKFSIMIIACLGFLQGQMIAAPLFGAEPKDQSAIALKDKVVASYRSQGVKEALRLLGAEAPAFIKQSAATGRYDFFQAMLDETSTGSGRDDLEWRLAMTEWCYQFTIREGEGYWRGYLTPIMHERYFENGRYGAARAVIDLEKARALETGNELDVAKLKTVGPMNPGFPAIGKKTLGNLERIGAKQFPLFISEARQDLMEGKWGRGMEAAALGCDHAMGNFKWYKSRPNLVDSKMMMWDLTSQWRMSKMLTAEGFQFLDLPELELKELDELNSFNQEDGSRWNSVLMGRSRANHLRYLLGKEASSKVIAALSEIQKELRKESYSSKDAPDQVALMIADIHFRDGNPPLGWDIINEIRSNPNLSRDMRFEADREWCRQRVQTALNDTVEPLLLKLLAITREGGLKRREIELYQIYSRLLIGLGRYEDALMIQRELIRLLKSFNLFPRLPGALYQLARIHALMGERDRAASCLKDALKVLEESKLPDDAKARLRTALGIALPDAVSKDEPNEQKTDLQPKRSMMIPLEGLPARGLFNLTNSSGQAVTGQVRFQGAGLVFQENRVATMIGVEVSVPSGRDELAGNITIPAGDFVSIDLVQNSASSAEMSKVSIVWTPTGGKPQSAEWVADKAEKGVSFAITDAGEYLDNPFYLIPVYHLFQYRDAFAQVADVRVVASAPSRIELYDQNDELVFVDADGDGAFSSMGDIVSKDLNRNSTGDFALDATKQEMRFRLFVRPLQAVPDQDLSLELQLLQQGQWVTNSTDRIFFPKKP